MSGEPLIQNILRYGEPMIDVAGFFRFIPFGEEI